SVISSRADAVFGGRSGAGGGASRVAFSGIGDSPLEPYIPCLCRYAARPSGYSLRYRGEPLPKPLTPPAPLSHRPPPDRERGERPKKAELRWLMRDLGCSPSSPGRGEGDGRRGPG